MCGIRSIKREAVWPWRQVWVMLIIEPETNRDTILPKFGCVSEKLEW